MSTTDDSFDVSLTLDIACYRGCYRKFHDRGATVTLSGLERKVSTESLCEEMCQERSKPHPLSRGLRREKRFSDAIDDIRRHSDPLILDNEANLIARRLRSYKNRLSARACIESVLHKSAECLHCSSHRNRTRLRLAIDFQFDACLLYTSP